MGTQRAEPDPEEEKPEQAEEAGGRKSRRLSQSREAERNKVAKPESQLSRKAAIACSAPVPQTDTGGWGEDPKADGRSIVKELGKMTP